MLLIPCILLQSIYQPDIAFNKIQFMTIIVMYCNVLHAFVVDIFIIRKHWTM
jgi:hypothetical protein